MTATCSESQTSEDISDGTFTIQNAEEPSDEGDSIILIDGILTVGTLAAGGFGLFVGEEEDVRWESPINSVKAFLELSQTVLPKYKWFSKKTIVEIWKDYVIICF